MAGGGTQQSLRKYLGAIKDTTTVQLAKVNSDYKDLDIAIIRATNHVEKPSKEKHVKAIFYAISASCPRADVVYCIHALSRRLSKTHNWAVALKTLMVIHRALREVDPTFREELINYGRNRGHMLNMSHFKDDSSANAWDYSAWVRAYALYLEERIECFRVLKYDVETDPPKTQDLDTPDLLEHLPALQRLLHCLLECQPQGAALQNLIIRIALTMVAEESVKIYCAISGGNINMVDKFFEMQRHDAVKALEIYRKSGHQAERLSEFYEVCRAIDIGRGERLAKIEQPPSSFLTAMEDYIKEAPRASILKVAEIAGPKAVLAIEGPKIPETDVQSPPPPAPQPNERVKEEPLIPEQPDLLDLNDAGPDAFDLENRNALALAIVPVENSSTTSLALSPESGTTGWELALVTAPTSNETSAASSKMGGGLDKLTLDSLYDEANRRANQRTRYNPWETPQMPVFQSQPLPFDPFYPSPIAGPVHPVSMAAAIAQQHQMLVMNQQSVQAPVNPFGNPYVHSRYTLQASNAYAEAGFI